MTPCSDRCPDLHAYLDGELDAANSADLERHLATCAACATELARMQDLRDRLAQPELRFRAPEALRAAILRQTTAEPAPIARRASERPPGGRGAIGRGRAGGWYFLSGGALGAALAVAASTFVTPAVPPLRGENEIVTNHVRSLLAKHLTDIGTSDQHQVRPWFNGRIDFAPPTPDLTQQGFPLAGGRLDYLGGHVVAAIVYHRRLHPLNVFVRPAVAATPTTPTMSRLDGYNLIRWRAGDLEYWVVSDLNMAELELFQRTFVAATSN